ncbi:acid-sensing ion channel 2-like [Haliotis asinina]|uniref:acid-sensing ion channel 2-like n=1 Tax=Haliotis asinina TaxID=109174 RepID=UPI0035326B52
MAGVQRAEFVTSQRGARQVLHAGFRYKFNKCGNVSDYWKCVVPRCRSNMSTTGEFIRAVTGEHNHGPDNPATVRLMNILRKRKTESEAIKRIEATNRRRIAHLGYGAPAPPRKRIYFSENTSMHGVSRFVGKPGYLRRTFWVLAVLAGAGVAVYNIWTIFLAFGTFEVSTVVNLVYNAKLRFPSITICNINAVKRSKLQNVSGDTLKTLQSAVGIQSTDNPNSLGNNSLVPRLAAGNSSVTDSSNTVKSAYSGDFTAAVSFQQATLNLTTAERHQIGHQIEDMLFGCTYQGISCTTENFTRFYNYMHGNCYTFTPTATDYMFSTKTGPLYGLSLMLNAEEDEYVKSLTNSVGFKVTVHNHHVMPFPEDDGFDIAPSFATSVGVRKVVVHRTPAPYGNCGVHERGGPFNIYSTQVENITYSDKACERSCLQALLVNRCGCCDVMIPCDAAALGKILETVPPMPFPQCNFRNSDSCGAAVMKLFEEEDTDCNTRCTPSCRDESYEQDLSASMWPASNHVPNLAESFVAQLVASGREVPISESSSASEKETFFRRNVMSVNVFFKALNYEKIETRPAYNWKRLLSDVGGQAGLWLGFSLLTLGEVLELIVDVAVHLVTKVCRRDQIKPSTTHR